MNSVPRVCEETSENCQEKSSSRGLCTRHYDRRKRAGTLPPLKRKLRNNPDAKCGQPGCGKVLYNLKHELCATHYNRFLKGIPMDLPVKPWGG